MNSRKEKDIYYQVQDKSTSKWKRLLRFAAAYVNIINNEPLLCNYDFPW